MNFTILRRHWLPLLGLNAAIVTASLIAAKTYAENFSPVWTARAELNLPVKSVDLNADLGSLGNLRDGGIGFSQQLNPLNLQAAILTSDVVLERVRAADPEKDTYPALGSYRNLFEVTPKVQSTIVSLEVEASSAELARQRLQALGKVYQQRLSELRREDAETRKQHAREELQRALGRLSQAQDELAAFKDAAGIADADEQTQQLIASIERLRTTRTTVAAERQAAQSQVQSISETLSMTPAQATASRRLAENLEYQAARGTLAEIETELAEARSTYTDAHPRVQQLLARQEEVRRERERRIAAAVPNAAALGIDTTLGSSQAEDSRLEAISDLLAAQATAAGLDRQASVIDEQTATLSHELDTLSRNRARLLDLEREREIAEGIYRGAIAQLEQNQTSPFNTYPNVQTLDAPTVDPNPSEPKLVLVAFGALLASVFGSAALVLFLEEQQPSLRPQDLQQSELPILVRLPRLKRPALEKSLHAEPEVEFQRLASAVASMNLESKRLLVTSSTSGEGKTTTTLGLSMALVNLGFRVLLVDGDLRCGELTRRLKRDPSHSEPVEIIPDLAFAPILPHMGKTLAEFCARGDFACHLERLQNGGNYDYVLVDSAPVSLTVEPALMSALIQNVLFVVRHGVSDRYSVMDSFEQLRQQRARLAGVVVNGVAPGSEQYRYLRQPSLLTKAQR